MTEIEALQEKNKIASEKLQKEFDELRLAFNRIFATSDGKLLGRWLIDRCGYELPSTVFSHGGDILPYLSIHNEAMRGIYIELRRYLDTESLINLEIKE